MKTYVFFVERNGNAFKVRNFYVEPEHFKALEKEFGNIYFTYPDAIKAKQLLEEDERKPKERALTDEERRVLEAEQIAYGWAQFTEEEKTEINSHYKWVKDKKGNDVKVPKTIDDYQLEFAREQMALESR